MAEQFKKIIAIVYDVNFTETNEIPYNEDCLVYTSSLDRLIKYILNQKNYDMLKFIYISINCSNINDSWYINIFDQLKYLVTELGSVANYDIDIRDKLIIGLDQRLDSYESIKAIKKIELITNGKIKVHMETSEYEWRKREVIDDLIRFVREE